MKSMKTLIISAAVCGAMALPISGTAQPTGDHKVAAAFSTVKSIVCVERDSKKYQKDPQLCTAIGKYAAKNGIDIDVSGDNIPQ